MDRISFLPVDQAPVAPPAGVTVAEFLRALAGQFGRTEARLMRQGRAAISAVLAHLALRRADEVFVTTTFDFPNVSSCVTCTIFNHCKPSRVLTDQTRVIFIIHEFGVPHPETPRWRDEARRRGIPLVEDCAHTIDSRAPAGWRVGELADWVIVSLPKILPVAAGGVLIGPPVSHPPAAVGGHVGEVAAGWWPQWPAHAERRRQVYRELTDRLARPGRRPLFAVTELITPWFFPVAVKSVAATLAWGRELAVDCAHWHGTDLVVFPCHQFLEAAQLGRIIEVIERADDGAPPEHL